MAGKKVILISDPLAPDLPDKLSGYGEVTDDKGRLPEAEVVVVRSKTKVTREYIDSAPNLKLIIRGGVGLDNVDRPYALGKGIAVRNTPEAPATAVAELAFTLMIAVTNHVVEADHSMHEGKWLKKELTRTELRGKTLGILGVGRIGNELAKRALAFDMRAVGFNPRTRTSPYAEMLGSMRGVLNISDYVSLHMPLTGETEGIINRETLKDFKDGAFLINTSRGRVIVEEDVARALRNGKLAGFGNDVWYSDPPENSPLMAAPNVLMTPHIGGSTAENQSRVGEIVSRIIGEYLEGR